MAKNNLKYYSFFLPQFHECPYNNEWWGKGFTEWNNVKAANPRYEGHFQPNVPNNGYYDLTDDNVLAEQFKRAKSKGIDGFVIYHYWYEGKRPLGRVIDKILNDLNLDITFSLCWANHSWTRSWSNRMGSLDVLIEQTYEIEDVEMNKHFDFLYNAFNDRRYIRIDDKPLFQVYIPENIPDLPIFISKLRKYVNSRSSSMQIHISAMITAWHPNWAYLKIFDSVTFFQPSLALFSPLDIFTSKLSFFKRTSLNTIIRSLPPSVKVYLYKIQDRFFNNIQLYDYDKVWSHLIEQYKQSSNKEIKVFPSSFINFDNTPRYGKRARIIKGFSAEKFRDYLYELSNTAMKNNTDPIIFINAWNEWGEGMYLEDDNLYGSKKLDYISEIKEKINKV